MQTIRTRAALKQRLLLWSSNDDCVAVVPTMGNLHEGHLSLVRIAKQCADRVVVTLFVNPTQFGQGEDFAAYPRSLESDVPMLNEAGVDTLFLPDIETVYPFGVNKGTRISVPGLTAELCGSSRPGHFDGVTSVVLRLFTLLQPDIAVFGQKDFQQQLVIRRMVKDLGLPIEILVGPVVREPSGLAMSSRNTYLTDKERDLAIALYRTLQQTASALIAGRRDYSALETEAMLALCAAQHAPEYVAIRQCADLAGPEASCRDLVILAASRVGGVRLIDNVVVTVR